MDTDRMIQVPRSTLESLLHRAQREMPRSPEERRAEDEVREALERDFQDAFQPQAEQLTLFDAADYERGTERHPASDLPECPDTAEHRDGCSLHAESSGS